MKLGLRRPSLRKTIAAYRSQWKRSLLRLFIPGYGRRGAGWLGNPKKANYNFMYNRTTFNIEQLLGFKPSRGHCWMAATAAFFIDVFCLPVDATKAAVQSGKIRREYKARSAGSGASKPRTSTSRVTTQTTANITRKTYATHKSTSATSHSTSTANTVVTKPAAVDATKKEAVKTQTTIKLTKQLPSSVSTEEKVKEPFKPRAYSFNVPTPKESQPEVKIDANAPKSKPKNPKDQYIPKKLIIAGSSFCDGAVLERLKVGSYIELMAEPDNEYDKNAVKLLFGGDPIGYIAKQDNFSYAICFKLGRKVYGVITDIDESAHPTKYEYETWYDMS